MLDGHGVNLFVGELFPLVSCHLEVSRVSEYAHVVTIPIY